MKNARWISIHAGILVLFLVGRILSTVSYNTVDSASRIGGFVSFTHEVNTGVAWGISLPEWLLYTSIGVLLMILIGFLQHSYRKKNLLLTAGLLFIVVGAISNVLDRIRFGGVVDYFHFDFWPAMNLADIMIAVGAVLLVRVIYRKPQKV